ncbi:diguanylate phosphodiesterase [Enterovibrio sp. ZSDZ35]|uniref:Diguanylate phosphodiesterase n=1 Tax=Enterovibrio qingdaonensis TaxID=2899818 RepID=A0ABT5QLX9_9GAMM|nr:diguanylate phosphodiesterase [Enterovibrio sp. ZSDZ35]MDD1781879.1 diguanylate phosphodiesterase [Enterovibrio sp. ZSDZ35]
MRHTFRALIRKHAKTDDDKLLYDALSQNDVHHVCQAIRETASGEVAYQHVTLRFGSRGEQSVYQFDLSEELKYALDLFSLYLALRQSRFQLDTYHPDLINKIVVPIDSRALIWPSGQRLLNQMIKCDAEAFALLIPSLILPDDAEQQNAAIPLLSKLRAYAAELCFDISDPNYNLTFIAQHLPDKVKLAISLEHKEDRAALLPFIRFFRSHRVSWIAGRVASQNELNQYRLLGASHYFGYFSDIPTSISFKSFETYSKDEDETTRSASVKDETVE